MSHTHIHTALALRFFSHRTQLQKQTPDTHSLYLCVNVFSRERENEARGNQQHERVCLCHLNT